MSDLGNGQGRRPRHHTVADAMLTDVKVSRAEATVGEVRALFDDDHVHSAVIVDGGVLLAVVDPPPQLRARDPPRG